MQRSLNTAALHTEDGPTGSHWAPQAREPTYPEVSRLVLRIVSRSFHVPGCSLPDESEYCMRQAGRNKL